MALATLLVSLLATLLLTPLIRRGAIRWGVVDSPDGNRKLHMSATPLCGGLAVLFGTSVGIVTLPLIVSGISYADLSATWSIFVSCFLICGLGLLDDIFAIRGRQKLIGQIVCTGVIIMGGMQISRVVVMGINIDLGIAAIPFTMLWLLGATNSLNLIDGMDGLATGVGIILSLAIGAMAHYTSGFGVDAVLAYALAGSLMAFMFFNFPPAKMFLGDAGSMLIGLLLGILAIRSSLKGPATIALAAPTAIWAIPAFDVAMAIVRRKLTGRSIYTTDRGHLHHYLQQNGYGNRSALLWIGLLCGVTALGALASVIMKNDILAIASSVVVLGTMVITRFFGYQECSLLGRRVINAARSLVPSFQRFADTQDGESLESRLQGSREWELLWSELTSFARRFDLHYIQLNVNVPSAHEEFHADWKSPTLSRGADAWTSEVPLMLDGMIVGRLKFSGVAPGRKVFSHVGDLVAALGNVENTIRDLLADLNDAVESEPLLLGPPHALRYDSSRFCRPEEIRTKS